MQFIKRYHVHFWFWCLHWLYLLCWLASATTDGILSLSSALLCPCIMCFSQTNQLKPIRSPAAEAQLKSIVLNDCFCSGTQQPNCKVTLPYLSRETLLWQTITISICLSISSPFCFISFEKTTNKTQKAKKNWLFRMSCGVTSATRSQLPGHLPTTSAFSNWNCAKMKTVKQTYMWYFVNTL